jgi:hypothetical protein
VKTVLQDAAHKEGDEATPTHILPGLGLEKTTMASSGCEAGRGGVEDLNPDPWRSPTTRSSCHLHQFNQRAIFQLVLNIWVPSANNSVSPAYPRLAIQIHAWRRLTH